MRHLTLILLSVCLLICAPSISQEPPRNLNRQLLDAIESGDAKTVKQLLDQGVRANTRSSRCDSTALELALMSEKIDIAKLLIKYGSTPDSLFPGNYRALSEAVLKGDTYILEKVLAQTSETNIDTCNESQNAWRLFTIATLKKDIPMLKALSKILLFNQLPNNRSYTYNNYKIQPLAIAVYFNIQESFVQILKSYITPYYNFKNQHSNSPHLPENLVSKSLSDAFFISVELKKDDYINKMLSIDPALLIHSLDYAGIHDDQDIYLKIILNLKKSTIKNLWNKNCLNPIPLIGTIDPKRSGIECYFYQGNRYAEGMWQAIAKLHAMGSRPSSDFFWVFNRYIDSFYTGNLSKKEFVDILRPLGYWPMEPSLNINDLNQLTDWYIHQPKCLDSIKDIKVAHVLLQAGVPIKSWRDYSKRSLLHYAMYIYRDKESVEKYIQSLLKECGLDINAKDADGQPALAYVSPLEGFIQFIDRGATTQWPSCLEGHALNRSSIVRFMREASNGGGKRQICMQE